MNATTTTPRAALAAAALVTVGLTAAAADAQTNFQQVNRIFVDDVFNGTSAFGDNPSAVAFDGDTAYIGGFNTAGPDATTGVVAVGDLFGAFGAATKTPLLGTTQSTPAGRGIEGTAYDPATDSIFTALSTGGSSGALGSFDATTGVQNFLVSNPSGVRPFTVGADPIAPDDGSLAAFLSQGSGRRLALDADSGALVYSTGQPSPGGAIIFNGSLGSAYRGADFDSEGNLAYATANGFGFAERIDVNTFNTTSDDVLLVSPGNNNIGRDIAILEGLAADGGDLFAIVARDSALSSGDEVVYIIDADGNIVDTLTGDESGLSTAFQNDTKSIDYGLAPDGTPTIVVTDFVERRLDVYQSPIPEPASLAVLGVAGLGLLRRRRA